MAAIDYYFSVLSPWAYFAGSRLEEIAGRQGASIAYKPVDAMKVFSETGGLPMAKRPPARLAYREQELRRTSAKTGMPYHFQPAHWPTDAVPASAAIIALAQAGGDAGALTRAFLTAVWVEQLDIATPEVVADKLASVGGDAAALAGAMEAAREVYAQNTREAVERGVFGVPFYLIGDEKFWGQDRLDDVEAHLARL